MQEERKEGGRGDESDKTGEKERGGMREMREGEGEGEEEEGRMRRMKKEEKLIHSIQVGLDLNKGVAALRS